MSQPAPAAVRFANALCFWVTLGFISDKRFLHALNYCGPLPGLEAQPLANCIRWLMHRTRGGSAAGALFVLQSLFILIALSWLSQRFGNVPLVDATHGRLGFRAPLSPITAAVVGVILNLAMFFGYHVLWPQGFGGRFDITSAVIALAAAVALFRFKRGVKPLLAACAVLGLRMRRWVLV